MDSKQEKIILENTLRLLRKGKYELSGDEAIVFHQCFSYLVDKLTNLNKPVIPVILPKEEQIIKKPKKAVKPNE